MFSGLLEGKDILAEPLNFILGGPRSGKTTLLECVLAEAANVFLNRRQIISLVQIRPHWREIADARNRIAVGITRGIHLYVEHLPEGTREQLSESVWADLREHGIPAEISGRFVDLYLKDYLYELESRKGVGPLGWSLKILSNLATVSDSTPHLLVDDADLTPGAIVVMAELLHLCKTYQIHVLASARSLCESTFDRENPLTEQGRTAEFVCLDFLPTDDIFRSMCRFVLEEQVKSDDMNLKRVAQRALLDDEVFRMITMLSSGQIGRFREVLGFLAFSQEGHSKWQWPSRREVGDFCESVVMQMLQRENAHELAETLRRWVLNLNSVLGTKLEAGLGTTWLTLPVDEMSYDMLSMIRSGILAWLLQCNSNERINVGKQPRFIPDKVRISPLAGITGRISQKRALK